MKELSMDKMEMVNGGLLSQYCQSDSVSFLGGATLAGTLAGGGIGFVVGLGVGAFGSLAITYFGKPC
ncbi:MAG: Blp family class II bacteriocin [Nitritalea sp.]